MNKFLKWLTYGKYYTPLPAKGMIWDKQTNTWKIKPTKEGSSKLAQALEANGLNMDYIWGPDIELEPHESQEVLDKPYTQKLINLTRKMTLGEGPPR